MAERKGMIGMVGAVLVLGAIVWAGLRSSAGEAPEVLTLEERYQQDERVDPLLYNSPFKRTFDAQVAYMVPLWVSKLEHGTKEPLRQAKKELGVAGATAVPELTNLWDEISGSADGKWRTGVLENILQACNNMSGPEALPLLRKALGHAAGSVRLAALPALATHGDASDYDLVAIWLPVLGSGDIKSEYTTTMKALDPSRFNDDVISWFRSGQHPEVWPYLALDAADCRDPEQAKEFKSLAPLRDDKFVPFLMAPSAALGDYDALQELLTRLNHERPGTRQFAIQALGAIGMTEALAPLIHDEHAGVRRLVVQELVDNPSETGSEYLRDATKDLDPSVRKTALKELVLRGHELTVAEALTMLEGSLSERTLAIDALRHAWDVNPGSAERAYASLLSVWQREELDPRARMSVLESLSHVQLEESAAFLMDFGRQYEGLLKGRTAHRLVCGMLWNTGTPGRDLMREALKTETDPFRRLDLIEFIWQDHSVASREALLGVLLDESRSPYERLYAADRLARIGPAEVVAPALKRVYTQNTHREVRPAMQTLLWTWYGQHDFH